MVFGENISLEEACKTFNYDENQMNVIRLIYAEEYYRAGDYKSGDAYDCDVNGDGNYDSDKERFYYVTDLDTNNKYAVLLYSYPTVNGVAVSSGNINYMYNSSGISYLGPVGYISHLPSSTQWFKVRLYNYRRQLKNENGGKEDGK